MSEFHKNDEEIDNILKVVGAGLSQLQDKTRKIGEVQNIQSDLLNKANEKADKTEATLRL